MALVGSSSSGPRPNVGSMGVSRSGSSILSGILFGGKAPGAPISRPTVAMPNKGNYGNPGPRPMIGLPDRKDYGKPSSAGIGDAAKTAKTAAKNFNDPTNSAAFKNLMALSQEQTGTALFEIMREKRDAANRAGFTGGAPDRAGASDRMRALAEAGFAGAAAVRKDELGLYDAAQSSFTDLQTAYNAEMGKANQAYASDLTSTRQAQAGLDLGFSKLVQERDLSFADATAEAQRLQAQLDQAYNGSLIDNARYNQMSASLAAQLESERMRLAFEKDKFAASNKFANQTREDALLEAARLRKERGVDPSTGQKYGAANPGNAGNPIESVLRRR